MTDEGSGLRRFFASDPVARRRLSFVILGIAAAVMIGAVLLYLFRRVADRDLYLALIVLILLLGAAQATLLFGKPARKEKIAPEEYLLADEAPVLEEDVYDVECGRCGTHFRVTDHLQRPLLALCPVCGAEGIVPIRAGSHSAKLEIAPSASAPLTGPSPPPPPAAKSLRLKCPRCQTVNTVIDSGSRPLRATCTGCGATIGVR
jgi:ribosomal protein S27E